MNFQKFTTFKTILIALVLTINVNQLFAQTTNGIFFQAVARDNFSNPAKDRKIYVQSSIIQTTPTGTKVLTEEHQANTDATGVFSVSLGNGVRVGGTASSLTTIDWSKGPFYLNLKVAITPIGGNSNWNYSKEWVDMGTTSFGAVPFALYSASSAKVDDKLNVSDTTTMLKVYAKAMSVKTLETSLATKLTAADTLTMLAPYAKAAYTIDSSFFKSQLATKLSIADSAKYVTATQLASYNFSSGGGGGSTIDTSSLSRRINLKANVNDLTSLNINVTSNTSSITANTTAITSNTAAISSEVATARAAELVLTNSIASNTSSITAETTRARASELILTNNIGSNTSSITANTTAITSNTAAISSEVATARAAELVLTNSIASNTSSITAETTRARASELILTNNIGSNTSSITANTTAITSNTAAISSEVATARAAELLISNSVATQTTAIATKLNITDTSYLLKKTDTASLSSRINLKLNASQLGIANGIASLNASGIIPSSQLPPVSLSSTSVVASDADMTALSATVGSIAIRTDLNKNYVLSTLPASTLSNWVELLTPAAPVQTVNGYTGSVNLAKSDISLSDVDNTSDISKPVSNATQAALNTKLDANKVGVASGLASLNALGKIPTDQIPAISFSSVKVLSSQVDMLALSSAVVGSVVIRTDENKNYVLAQTNPAVLSNWIQLLTPAPPVQTVNGYSGNVSIAKSDLGLGNIDNTSDANKPISAATLSSLNSKANTSDVTALLALKSPLASPNFTGAPTAPTAAAGINTTQLATTAFVNNATSNINASSISGTIAVSKGGTGATTLTGLIKGTGTSAFTVATAGTDYLLPTGSAASLTSFPTFNQNTTGNATTATIAGNITATSNSTLSSLSSLNTVGTITSGSISLTTNIKTSGTLTAGTVTYPNAHNSTAGQVLTINAGGTASWATPASSSGAAHTVGEYFGGGIVFYITSGGFHGLIAETYENGNGSNEEALDFVTNPTFHNSTYGGNLYTDWRVPTYYELTLLYAARATNNLNLTSGTYVSCTFTAYSTYKNLKFSNNTIQYENANWVPRSIRAIRSF